MTFSSDLLAQMAAASTMMDEADCNSTGMFFNGLHFSTSTSSLHLINCYTFENGRIHVVAIDPEDVYIDGDSLLVRDKAK